MKATEILQEADLAWLVRFTETAEDDNSYDTPKDALKRLIELGAVRLADANLPQQDGGRAPSGEQPLCDERDGCAGTVEHTEGKQAGISRLARQRRATGGHWANADWLPCQGGKWRPVEPGTFPLAHGITCRMDKLRAFGNAISPQVAEAFIRAFLDRGA